MILDLFQNYLCVCVGGGVGGEEREREREVCSDTASYSVHKMKEHLIHTVHNSPRCGGLRLYSDILHVL